jgi:signal transduction histidine kinase
MSAASIRRFLVALIAGVAVMLISAARILAPVDAFFTDVFLRLVPARPSHRVTVVAIDEASLQQIGSWPWSRTQLGMLVSRIHSAGAKTIGIDLLLNEIHADDPRLAAACRPIRCIAASMLDDRGAWVLPARSLGSTVIPAHAAFELDDDGILRRISTTKQDSRVSLPAFPLALAGRVSRFPVASGRPIVPGFRTAPAAMPTLSAAEVLNGNPAALTRLRGQVVVVGLTAFALGDRVLTPRSQRQRPDPGVQVHAAAIESLLAGDTLREVPPFGIGLLAAVLAWMTVSSGRSDRNVRRVAAELGLVSVPLAVAVGLIFGGFIASPVAVSAVIAGIAMTGEARRAVAMIRHGRAAAVVLREQLGEEVGEQSDVGAHLESLAAAIVRRRIDDVESKRVVAHELKTPLASMKTLSQLLTGFELSAAERRRLATLLGEETEKLQAMVTGLLEVERLSLRPKNEVTERFDLARVLTQRVEVLSHGVSRTIEMSVDGSEAGISGDTALLERVIDNLVGNAIKYSPELQPVSIAFRTEAGHAVLDVMDRGAGVPKSDRERIFARFTRGSTASGTEGLGLGLALVGEAVRWHRGTVTVHDRDGGGAIFRVRIPLATPQAISEAV